MLEHPRPEHRVGLAVAQRPHQIGQALRRVLPVAVHQRDEVEAVLDGEVVADLLVAAVALVDRVEEHVQRERQRACALRVAALLERAVLRRIVEHQHFDVVLLAPSWRGTRASTWPIVVSAL